MAHPAPASVVRARIVHRYALDVPQDARQALARRWLLLGLAALIASGVLSLLLVLSRTPGVAKVLPVADFFHVALVAHVDLSVLVWFLAFAGVLWSLNSRSSKTGVASVGFTLAAAGTAALALAPFAGQGRPVMANYIPVLDEPLFLGGLVVFAAGVGVLVLRGDNRRVYAARESSLDSMIRATEGDRRSATSSALTAVRRIVAALAPSARNVVPRTIAVTATYAACHDARICGVRSAFATSASVAAMAALTAGDSSVAQSSFAKR